MNPFVLQPMEYQRNLNIVQTYVDDTVFYLAKNTGKPIKDCADYVLKAISQGGEFPLHNPDIIYLEAKTRGNREQYEGTLLDYLKDVTTEHLLMAPSLTTYVPPEKHESLLGKYILGNMSLRNSYKKDKFRAKQSGDSFKEIYYEILQTTCKIKNNSLSGAHASPYTPLYNKSSHSSLTSTCRVATSYSNSNNEKFIAGNRHYWSPDIVVANIITITRQMNRAAVEAALVKYELHIPTPDDVISVIRYSSDVYWRDDRRIARIRDFVCTLDDAERAAFVYSGDMYHMAVFNPVHIRDFLDILSTRADVADPAAKGTLFQDEDVTTLATLLCADITAGISLDDVKKGNPDGYDIVETTAYQIQSVLDTHAGFIQAFMRPSTRPQSVASIPNMVRKAVITSDTDSTIFTTQHWTIWYTGELCFTPKAYGIGYAVTFLAAKMVAHVLAMMSANLGVGAKKIHRLRMKNEFYFPIFALTPSAKTYYAYKSAQEGMVFKEMELELKGVALRSSNAPKEVNSGLRDYLKRNMDLLLRDGSLGMHDILDPVTLLEKDIINNVVSGGHRYYKSVQIKDPSSYVKGMDAPASQYNQLWQEVWAPKYGECPAPPYSAVKVSLTMDNRTRLGTWLDTMADRDLAERMRGWLARMGKQALTTMMLPTEVIDQCGVPQELIEQLELRKLIVDIAAPFYIILESYGIYMRNDKITRLVSDTWMPLSDGIKPGDEPPAITHVEQPAIPALLIAANPDQVH